MLDADIYNVLLQKGTRAYRLFESSPRNSSYNKLFNEAIKDNPDNDFYTNEEEKAKVMADENTIAFTSIFTYIGNKDVVTLDVDETFHTYASLGLQKDSEFREIFNYHLLKMKQSGTFWKFEEEWFSKKGNQLISSNGPEKICLGYNNLLFPFSILAIGAGLSIILAGLEYWRLKRSSG